MGRSFFAALDPQTSTLHVHLDESGTLKFTPTGSRYYVFAVAWTYSPQPLALRLQLLRFRLLRQGLNLEKFHATEDHPRVREAVLQTLLSHRGWRFAAAVVEKKKVPPKDREQLGSFYARFATVPLQFLLRGPVRSRAHKVLVYTDRFPQECERELTEKAVKIACRQELPAGLPFHVYHHASSSNSWLQVADYCAWAVARKWEQSDPVAYQRLVPRLARGEQDVLHAETAVYY